MKKKDYRNLIFDLLDGEISPEERLLLEKECHENPELAKEKESMEKVIAFFKNSRRFNAPSGFTERVMERIKKRPIPFKQRIVEWIRSDLEIHMNWAWKWAMVSILVFSILGVAGWQYFRLQRLHSEIETLERRFSELEKQPIPMRFVFYNPSAKSVHLAGTFNDWRAGREYQLANLGQNGIWSITLMLEPGVYEYMFLVDGKDWITDPAAMDFCPDGFGRKNSIVEVVGEI